MNSDIQRGVPPWVCAEVHKIEEKKKAKPIWLCLIVETLRPCVLLLLFVVSFFIIIMLFPPLSSSLIMLSLPPFFSLVIPFPPLPSPYHYHCIPPSFVIRLYYSSNFLCFVVCSVASLSPTMCGTCLRLAGHHCLVKVCYCGVILGSSFTSGFAMPAVLIIVHYAGIWGMDCCCHWITVVL